MRPKTTESESLPAENNFRHFSATRPALSAMSSKSVWRGAILYTQRRRNVSEL